ncbi:MAG TPA: glycosyltransferase, partial [Smithellaceae bacterium]|nr:glycosyltransferase [Smithellaceae bacterium]
TVSKWLAERVKQSFLRDKSIKVIHNGIDTTNIFYVRSFDHLKEKHNITNEKVILAVAPDLMSERKGGRHVLRLAKRMKNERIKFILIGVKEINEKYDDNVLALPRTENQHELAAYYSMADVFVICSQKETFGLTCVESLSCGTPVCGFNAGGNMEIVPDSMGKLVEYGDMDALENSVRHFLKKENISRECSEYGQVAFSKEKMFENYFKLYQQNFLDWRVVGGASSLGKNKDKKIVGALKNS